MPRPGRGVPEKSKDFTGSIKRLIENLKPWKVILVLSLILAMTSSILALISPNKLSDLTDTISKGITPNTEVLEEINTKMLSNFSEEKIGEKIPVIMSSTEISDEDKNTFTSIMSQIHEVEENEMSSLIFRIPASVMNIILEDITIDNTIITVEDQLNMLTISKTATNENSLALIEELPESIYSLIKPTINMEKVKELAIFIGSLYIISALFGYIQNFSMSTMSNKFAKSLRTQISKKINKLPLKYFDSHEIGDVLSRVTNDVDTVAQNLNQSIASLVSSITLFIGAIIMMFVTNGIMAITAILSSLIGFSLMFLILGKSQKYFIQRQKELGNLNGHIEEIYSGHNVVRAYNGTNKAIEEFEELNNKLYDANRKSQFLSGLMHPIMGFIGNFGYVTVCLVGALLVTNGNITFGVIIAFIIYVRMFTNPLSQIAQAMTSLQSIAAAAERVFEFFDEKEMSDEGNIRKHLDKSKVKGQIEFKNVKFGYDRYKTIINDFSVSVKPGQKVAIVGPTGAGKTTMVNLLMKFYEINDGDILIDGVSINELSRENIHDLFCMVLQDTWLFEGTVGENIKFNKEDISEEEIWKACHVVGVDHFIKTLPGGLESEIGDSDTVSSGQKQLFTIARGMLKDAPFLILDEATSNVDTRTEELVQKAMDKLTEGRTSFIIAHRLSTIKNADLILVMNDGNIIEQGNHEELMKQDGFYTNLYNSQFEKIN